MNIILKSWISRCTEHLGKPSCFLFKKTMVCADSPTNNNTNNSLLIRDSVCNEDRRIRMSGPKARNSCSFITIVLVIFTETIFLAGMSNCSKVFYVHWNISNPIFRIDNTDHIIDVNKGNVPFDYDQVNIICPGYKPGTPDEVAEKYIIYNVSKEEYDTCRITSNPRMIAICNKPHMLLYFTITFRPFTPQPGGMEFQPGNDYYFISTSSRGDLYRHVGGRCSTDNMKIVFKVCCRPEEMNNQTVSNRALTTTTSTTTSTTTTTTTTTSTVAPQTTTLKNTSFKDLDGQSYNVKSTTKKSNDYDKHPNEVVKNEELTLSSSCRMSQNLTTVIVAGLIVLLASSLLRR